MNKTKFDQASDGEGPALWGRGTRGCSGAALVLTLPTKKTETDDGLLTASKVRI